MQPPTTAVDLLDPAAYTSVTFHRQLAALRAVPGLYRHPEPDGPGFWVVSRHADALDVYADPARFSSRSGIRLGGSVDAAEAVADQMMVVSDPPRHGRIRRVVGSPFTPTALAAWQDRITAGVAALVDEVVEQGRCDLVTDLAVRLPNQVVCAMMDLPRSDWAWIGRLTTQGLDSPDPLDRLDANAEIFLYFADLLAERRVRPGDDLVSALVAVAGDLSDDDLIVNLSGVLTGASETVRYSAAGGVHEFAQRPNLWDRLREAPDRVPLAVEEVLRWTSPGLHALRTVTAPVEVAGTRLSPGDRVTVWNCSANRDPAVFAAPETFLPDRNPNRHIAFGWGPHVCVGSRVARLELRALFTALAGRVRAIMPAGEPAWGSGNFIHGLTSLPVDLLPDPHSSPAGRH